MCFKFTIKRLERRQQCLYVNFEHILQHVARHEKCCHMLHDVKNAVAQCEKC